MNIRYIFIFILLLIFIVGCREQIEKISKDRFSERTPPDVETPVVEPQKTDEQIEDFSLEGYDDNRQKSWQIKGDNAQILGEKVLLENVKAISFDEEGEAILTSKNGWINKNTHNVYLNKDVVITRSDGAKLYTDSISWNKDTKIAHTEDLVKINQKETNLEGKGACTNTELDKITLKHNVKLETKSSTIITCRGPLDIDYKKNIAFFNKNVKVVDRQDQLLADKMEVSFNPETRVIEKIIATGNVIIKMGGNISFSKKAIYYNKDKKISLLGNPKLIIYPSELEKMELEPSK